MLNVYRFFFPSHLLHFHPHQKYLRFIQDGIGRKADRLEQCFRNVKKVSLVSLNKPGFLQNGMAGWQSN